MKITRRNFLEGAAGIGACAALSPLAAKAQGLPADQGLIWPQNQLLPSMRPAFYLDAADITTLTADHQLLLTTLQGVINRRDPRIYLFSSGDGTDQTWLNTLNIPNNVTSDPLGLITKYSGELSGAIIYDPASYHTINAATSLAGLMNAVVCSADLAEQYGLSIVFDFRGRFGNSKIDLYNWVLANYGNQLTRRLVAGINPANSSPAPGVTWTTVLAQTTHVHNSSNKNTYTIDLSSFLTGQPGQSVYVRFQDYFQNEGFGPSVQQVTVMADGNTIASFQPTTSAEQPFLYEDDNSAITSGGWRFADASAYFIYQFNPPAGTTTLTMQVLMWNQYLVTATNQTPLVYSPNPRFRDYIVASQALVFWLDPEVPGAEAALFAQILQQYGPNTPYLGWFVDGREVQGTTLLSENASFVVCTDLFDNASVLAGVLAPIVPFQPAAQPPELGNKVYVTITVSEGDNMQYVEHRMRQIWDDPNRGQTPLNWSIDPVVLDIAPPILNYYQATQTANDFLVSGPSGTGYTYPGAWPANALPSYTQITGRYMERTGMNVIFTLNHPNGAFQNFTDAIAADYVGSIRGLLGLLNDWTSTSNLTTPDGLPVVTQVSISSIAQGQTALANATARWNGSSPLFVAISAIAWNLTPTQINTLVSSLGPQYEVVRGDVFFTLIRQNLGLT